MSPFNAETSREFTRRHDRLLLELRQHGAAGAVFTSMESLFYLTGATVEPLERPFFLVIDAISGGRTLLVPELERAHLAKAWSEGLEIRTYRDFPAPAGEGWRDHLEPLLGSSFVVDPEAPLHIAQELLARGGTLGDLLRPVRLIKSPYEIERVAIAADYARRGMENLLTAAYRGATVGELYMTSSSTLRSVVAEQDSFDPLATSVTVAPWPAPLSSQPHAIPSMDATLEAGPHVVMALTRINGYSAECERTFFTTQPTSDEHDAFAAMMAARKLAFSLIRPGIPGAEVDAAVNDLLRSRGFGHHGSRQHRLGHGFGLSAHEPPWLAVGGDDVLAENMLISIEPGVYIDGVGGYRHSDTVLVTSTGYRVLTPTPDGIESLTLSGRPLARRLRGKVMRRLMGMS